MKTKTRAAIAAGAIRAELKKNFPEIKFCVRSENYAGGDAVRISYDNGVPSDSVQNIADKYQEGNFNGMIDLYEYKENPENLPRAKYITVNRHIDEAIRDQVKKDIAERYEIKDSNNEDEWFEKFNRWSDQVVWRELQKMTI